MRIIDKYATEYAKIVIMGNKIDIRPRIVMPEEDYVTKEDGLEAAFCYQGEYRSDFSYLGNNECKGRRNHVANLDVTKYRKSIQN